MHTDLLVAIIGLLSALVGSILGCTLGYSFSKRKSKDEFNANLFFEYQNIVQELVSILQGIFKIALFESSFTEDQNIDDGQR